MKSLAVLLISKLLYNKGIDGLMAAIMEAASDADKQIEAPGAFRSWADHINQETARYFKQINVTEYPI